MKTYNINPVLIFTRLLTAGLLIGVFYGKSEKYKQLKTNYGILQQENIYLKRNRRKILRQQQRFRSMRHEMKNDYILEMAYLKKELYWQLEKHYQKKMGYIRTQKDSIYTGSIGLDAILNHKLETASKDSIQINVQHELLNCIKINNYDLNVLLGNLLDNAMEAVLPLKPEERQISLTIKTNANILFLETANKYLGAMQKDSNGNYLTQKANSYFHGLGLLRASHIAHKYGGNIVCDSTGNHFNVQVLLYMPEN